MAQLDDCFLSKVQQCWRYLNSVLSIFHMSINRGWNLRWIIYKMLVFGRGGVDLTAEWERTFRFTVILGRVHRWEANVRPYSLFMKDCSPFTHEGTILLSKCFSMYHPWWNSVFYGTVRFIYPLVFLYAIFYHGPFMLNHTI